MRKAKFFYIAGMILMFIMIPVWFIPGAMKFVNILGIATIVLYVVGYLMIRQALRITGFLQPATTDSKKQAEMKKWIPMVGKLAGAILLLQIVIQLLQRVNR